MSGLRYAEVSQRGLKFLDRTSLAVEEFDQLVPGCEEAFQERMNEWRLAGKRRRGRGYTTSANCPLPTRRAIACSATPVDLKTHVLQVVQAELFAMPQNKANQWIPSLLPVLQTTLRRLLDAAARSLEQLAQRLDQSMVPREPEGQDSPPLFAMLAPNGASSVPQTRLNRKAILAARKNAIR